MQNFFGISWLATVNDNDLLFILKAAGVRNLDGSFVVNTLTGQVMCEISFGPFTGVTIDPETGQVLVEESGHQQSIGVTVNKNTGRALFSGYPPNWHPTSWKLFGHKIVSDIVYGHPQVGFEHNVTCSCGKLFLGRSTSPEDAICQVWDSFCNHFRDN